MSQARRPRSIELPNVGHKAPIPLGSRVGNILCTSGLIGKDPRQPALHFERMYRDNQWTIGTVAVTAISALEMAMWDLKGKVNKLQKMCGG